MKHLDPPRMSVVIPTHGIATHDIPTRDRSESLCGGLRALARQRLPRHAFEVIVSDSGSPGDTRAVVDAFRDELRITHHVHGGSGFPVSAARNAGARLAGAPILVLLDAGAEVGPDYLAHHLTAHEEAATPQAVVGYAYCPLRSRDVRHDRFAACRFDLNRCAVPWTFWWATNASVRTADYWAVGGFDETFRGPRVADMEFGYRLYRRGLPFRLTGEAGAVAAPRPRDAMVSWHQDKRDIVRFHDAYPEPVAEIGWALISSSPEDYWRWEENYRYVLAWTERTRTLDVALEIAEGIHDVSPGERVAVFGCGGTVPETLPPSAALVDFDADLLRRAAGGRHPAHHGIGTRTPLPDLSVDLVVLTSRLTGLWPVWGQRILAEARRVGTRVHAAADLLDWAPLTS